MQKQGIGSALWQRLSQEITLNPSTLTTWVRECYPDAIQFAQKVGFQRQFSSSPWQLNLGDTGSSDFRPVLDKVDALGIEITTLTMKKQKDSEYLTKLYDLRTQLDKNVPGMEQVSP